MDLDPIIGQALLLDADLVPLAMQMYPGNDSEKPYIRRIIDEMKQRCKVSGKTVQVATTSCRMVTWEEYLAELEKANLKVLNYYIDKTMYIRNIIVLLSDTLLSV